MYLTKYTYDDVNRLINYDRGNLNVGKDAISGTAASEEDWELDMTGNWDDFVQTSSGSTDLDQEPHAQRSQRNHGYFGNHRHGLD
jgi:hypothetical protein